VTTWWTEEEREHDPLFKLAQRFRAGVEGSISFLERSFRLARCMNKGWESYGSTVGATILARRDLGAPHQDGRFVLDCDGGPAAELEANAIALGEGPRTLVSR
jgi:hypothetical protein